jgi:hypothetical protein
MIHKFLKVLVCCASFNSTYEFANADEISSEDVQVVTTPEEIDFLSILFESMFSKQYYGQDETEVSFYRLLDSYSCPKQLIQEIQVNRNLCAEGYLNLCEYDNLESYLKQNSKVLEKIYLDTDIYNIKPWDLQDTQALKLMHNCNSGIPKACILVSDYISEYMGHEAGRISGCTLQDFEPYHQRQIKRADWLLKGAELANSKALASYIAVTDGCSGLLEYGKERDCQNGRKAQIKILEKLVLLEPVDDEFSSTLKNGLGDAYAYTGQYQKSYVFHSEACKLQNARSCFELGHQTSHGYGFLPKNHLKAVQYFDMAIYFGDQSDNPQTEKFYIYSDPDSPMFDLRKAASAVESCSGYSTYCRDYLLALVAYLGEPIIGLNEFDTIIMDHEYKYKYATQQLYDFPFFGPSDFSDQHYVSNSFWFETSSIYYMGSMLKHCYARNANACLLMSYLFSDRIRVDTGLRNLSPEGIERRSVVNLLPKPNALLSYKYLLMTEKNNLSDKYINRYYTLAQELEKRLTAPEKTAVQDAATVAKLWAIED